jgi:hypothetical protein
MKGAYKAAEVSAPGALRIVERSVSEPKPIRFGFGWRRAESVTPARPPSPLAIRVWFSQPTQPGLLADIDHATYFKD